MKVYEGKYPPQGTGKIAVIVAKYNKTITQRLLDGALAKLKEGGIRDADIDVVWVPGAFEIPTMAQRFAFDDEYAAVICLGCVIKGETTHDEHINRAVSLQLARLGVDSGIPVIFGILTCNNAEQAAARSTTAEPSNDKTAGEVLGNKGTEAAEAALEMLDIFSQLPELEEDDSQLDSSLLASVFENAKRYSAGDFDDEADGEFDEDDEYGEFPADFHRGHHKEHDSFGHDRKKSGKDQKHRSFDGKKPRKEDRREFKDYSKKGKSKFPKKGK